MSRNEYIQDVAKNINTAYMGKYSRDAEYNLDIMGLVSKLGGSVYERGYVQMNGNSLKISESDDSFEIYVSAVDNKKRQKFTIAHELGHYIIHYLGGDPKSRKNIYYRTSYAEGGISEYEANVFAANLLMPQEKFMKCFEEQNRDLGIVADKFGVSIVAAEVRARSLGLLG